MGQVNYSSTELNAVSEAILGPTKFIGKSTSDNGSPHTLVANTPIPVVFVDVDFIPQGDFTYAAGILTYTGTPKLEMDIDISCNIEIDTINDVIYLQQFKNGVAQPHCKNAFLTKSIGTRVALSLNGEFTLETGDELNLRVGASADCDVVIYNWAIELTTNKVIL